MDEQPRAWLGDAAVDFIELTRAAYQAQAGAAKAAHKDWACPFCRGSGQVGQSGNGFVVYGPCTCRTGDGK